MTAARPAVLLLAAALGSAGAAAAATLADDPLTACDRAAARAEAQWALPPHLLSAIGMVESGRRDVGSGRPLPWPWTINADGHGYFLINKEEAVGAVRAMQTLGRQVIDVGCFQVDLFYHPNAFASLDEAFDPEANATAAARILMQGRMSSTSWESAIALYHSASPILGGQYLRQVQAAWPLARARPADVEVINAVLVSPRTRQARVTTQAEAAEPPANLPRVITPQSARGVLQWVSAPAGNLPVVLPPPPRPAARRAAALLPK